MRKNLVLLICFTLILGSLAVGCNNAAQRPDLPQQQQDQNMDRTDEQMTDSERRALASRLSDLAEQVDGVKDATVVVSSIGMTDSSPDTGTNAGRDTQRNLNVNDPTSPLNNNQGMATNRTTTNNQATNNTNMNNMQNRTDGNSVSGLMVMVGLTLDNKVNGADETNQIKRSVMNKLKASDKRISQVLVTTDPGLVQRLTDVAAGIIQGRPIQGFENDINDLTRNMRQQNPAF
ncbi:MAG: YhcN/YlaJ family sporulation lipoprotein [Syntrophomonadaceae bacterium]|nr:YhcN/YlaJ family sporulation lipoprotein [Bacillota bacterium]NLP23255.1 hypothetical protein [Syntrophomonadaceae bacterium]